ncbi:hypothetical protein [Streptomyces sp. BSE7-9]|uniref:hypothetical protein n=1 Tax=Streptomyces sp. BSE7-9 TaxID=2759948 RepID=UPI000FE1D9AA|nr:hypothetical protein [Streptomyces sp. BSE7-9]MBJ6646012.1 hypothetical protein [Streptomyces sp. BSE7-9]
MLNSKKIIVAVGALCAFAVIGVGQAAAVSGSSACAENGGGGGRCVQKSEHHYTSDENGNIRLVNHQSQDCVSGNCTSRIVLGGKVIEEKQSS